ncbi:unnamed protein product [Echinostoma caproni]|uniref:Molybdopterin molybdenumtransferase n=1 Tax=Echinostoma caproni TaxID=27848 RepID=A0A183AMX1_9TREM|nr:unnamed protein product [Echinostoma caproni]
MFGVLTVSDTCSADPSLNRSGPAINRMLESSSFIVSLEDCVPDESSLIQAVLLKWIASGLVHVILTTGGTGIARRDVTADTVSKLIEQPNRLPGLEHALYKISLEYTPKASLSRMIAGVRDEVLLVALPGSTSAVCQCVPVILPVVKHAVEQLRGWVKGHGREEESVKSKLTNGHTTVSSVVSRPRSSPFPMISVEDAQGKLFQVASALLKEVALEAVYYKNAEGRVLARTLRSRQIVPPFDASVMDGYAVRFADGTGVRRVLGVLYAGDTDGERLRVKKGTCVRVSTGGPIPLDADCVVPVENTRLVSEKKDGNIREEDKIEVLDAPSKLGEFIRPKGSDLSPNTLFNRGLRLHAAELGMLASAGVLAPWSTTGTEMLADNEPPLPQLVMDRLALGGHIPCFQQPRIGLLSTGTEVVDGATVATSSAVYDANRPVLISLLHKFGFHTVTDFGIVPDEHDVLVSALSRALATCDILVTTGGVSMGERDLVTRILFEEFGAIVHFARVFMKPGKPTTLASVPRPVGLGPRKSILILCLPGNPVSTFVTAHLFLLPLLRVFEMRSENECQLQSIRVRLLHSVRLSDRPDYRRARLVWELDESAEHSIPCATCDHAGSQISSRLASCLDSDLLILIPPTVKESATTELEKGSIVQAYIL